VRLTILHTNDIHGRVDGLARIATLVERIRAETPHAVLFLDAGDVEETTNRLSNITKGAAMHRLLGAAGCDAATVGNAGTTEDDVLRAWEILRSCSSLAETA